MDRTIPCKECITYVLCKERLRGWGKNNLGVSDLAVNVDCKRFAKYLYEGDEYMINSARELFGLESATKLNHAYMLPRLQLVLGHK